jgi:O-antigen/teichoic acid export membrane protein
VRLARTGSQVLVWRAAQKLAGALAVLLIAQGLGPEGNGRYSLTLLVLTVGAAVLAGGVGLASVPVLRSGRQTVRRVLGAQALWIAGVAILLVLGALAVRAGAGWSWLANSLGWTDGLLVAAVVAILAMLVFETLNYDLLAAGRVVFGTAASAVRALGLLLLLGGLLLAGRLDLTATVWVLTGVHVAAAVAAGLRLRRAVREGADWTDRAAPTVPGGGADVHGATPLSRPRLALALAGAGWLGQLSALSYLLLLRLDQVILESAAGVAAVGVYALAAWAAELLWLVPEALNPLLVHSSAGAAHPARDRTAARAVRLALAVTALAAVPLALLAPPLLGVLRDGAYTGVATPLWALLPGVVAFAPGAVLAGDFIGRGRPTWNTQASAVTVGINVILCWWWIPSLGILGAAWSSTVAYAVGAAIMVARFRRVTGLPLTEILLARPSDLRR